MSLDRRETVMLAHIYDKSKHNVDNWFASIKYDGMRCLYDGGITRGLPASVVPFANCEKHYIRREEVIATGLWSRLFQPIMAPDWFLDQLPPFPLDGELYLGRGRFQEVMSTCKKYKPDDSEWESIKYMIFDLPSMANVLMPGKINVPSLTKIIDDWAFDWAKERIKEIHGIGKRPSVYNFEETYKWMVEHKEEIENDNIEIVSQDQIQGKEWLEEELEKVSTAGDEGLMIRNPHSHWEPKRSHNLKKMKKLLDSEGTVIGYVYGRETDRGSKLLGKIGALVIEWKGIIFELSGMTDAERTLGGDATRYGESHPGETVPRNWESPIFPRGSQITFRYKDLTVDGKPKEARYWRRNV